MVIAACFFYDPVSGFHSVALRDLLFSSKQLKLLEITNGTCGFYRDKGRETWEELVVFCPRAGHISMT